MTNDRCHDQWHAILDNRGKSFDEGGACLDVPLEVKNAEPLPDLGFMQHRRI
jgi:hypothetical protein